MDRAYPKNPLVGVGVAVFHADRVLLIRRGKEPRKGQWSLPGGLQHLGETVAEAARREVREETGLELERLDQIAVVDSIRRDVDGRVAYHYTLIDFAAEARSDEARAGDDAAAVAWVGLDELERYGLWAETVRIIRLSAERLAR